MVLLKHLHFCPAHFAEEEVFVAGIADADSAPVISLVGISDQWTIVVNVGHRVEVLITLRSMNQFVHDTVYADDIDLPVQIFFYCGHVQVGLKQLPRMPTVRVLRKRPKITIAVVTVNI